MASKSKSTSKAKRAGRKAGQGMNWIRLSTRLAIYARDGFQCVYCGNGVECEYGRGLTLDHVTPCELGGTNKPENLVTACGSCNSSKQDRPMREFLSAIEAVKDEGAVARRVRNATRRKLDRALGRRLANARQLAG